MTTIESATAAKLTNTELKAVYAAKRDAAKEAHDLTSGTFKYESYAQFKNQYLIDWDFAHPLDKDALEVAPTPTVLDIINAATKATKATTTTTIKQQDGNKVSKMHLAKVIFAQEIQEKGASGLVRKHILSRFMMEAGCTAAGANTYYNTIRSAHGLVKHP